MSSNQSNRGEKGRFQKGVSGNPTGRPKGDGIVMLKKSALGLFSDQAGKVMGVILQAAFDGDATATELSRTCIIPGLLRNGKISDAYIAKLLGLKTSVACEVVGLINAKRAEITIKRRIKNGKD